MQACALIHQQHRHNCSSEHTLWSGPSDHTCMRWVCGIGEPPDKTLGRSWHLIGMGPVQGKGFRTLTVVFEEIENRLEDRREEIASAGGEGGRRWWMSRCDCDHWRLVLNRDRVELHIQTPGAACRRLCKDKGNVILAARNRIEAKGSKDPGKDGTTQQQLTNCAANRTEVKKLLSTSCRTVPRSAEEP